MRKGLLRLLLPSDRKLCIKETDATSGSVIRYKLIEGVVTQIFKVSIVVNNVTAHVVGSITARYNTNKKKKITRSTGVMRLADRFGLTLTRLETRLGTTA